MKPIDTRNIQRLLLAGALGSQLVFAGFAASAHTNAVAATSRTENATAVSLLTDDLKARREAEFEQANADARRVAFRHLGASL